MNNHHHLAHFDELIVRKGQKVKRGQLLGYLGTTGASNGPHVHYEIMRHKPDNWNIYTQGMTKEEVEATYLDPRLKYIDTLENIPCAYDRFTGYSWLSKTSGGVYHPGVDMNHGKDGWADYRSPVLAPCDGEIVYEKHDGKYNHGWGNHCWIEEAGDPIDEEFAAGLAKRPWPFFLQVEQHGELWYVTPEGERVYMHPDDIIQMMRREAVGISDEDLKKVPIRGDNSK